MRMADYHKDNASFMLYKNWRALFDSCTDEEAGRLIKALFGFACDGEVPELDRMLSGIFMMMTQQMKADGEKWEKKCEKNAEKARKRWSKEKNADEYSGTSENATACNSMQEDTTAYDGIQTHTDKIREDKIREDKISKDKNNISPNAEAFEKVWAQYPKREGKKEAFAAFERSIKKGTTVEQIESGIQAYCEHIKKCNIDRQYIKQGSTYFRQEAWNDDYSDKSSIPDAEKPSYDIDQFEKFAITFSGNCSNQNC